MIRRDLHRWCHHHHQIPPNMCVHDTLIGAFIIYSPNEVRVDIFENINGIGTETDHIVMDYNQLIH